MKDVLDLVRLAQLRDWRSEDPLAFEIFVKQMSAGKVVHIVQETAAIDWHAELPSSARILPSVPDDPDPVVPLLIITDRMLGRRLEVDRLAVLRPPSLTLGVACRREITSEELEEAFRLMCREEGYSPRSLTAVGASARRKEHHALEDFADRRKLPMLYYPESSFLRAPWENPGKMAGTCAVSALLAAGVRAPIVTSKPYFGKLTLSLARRHPPASLK